jgi:hypothetical protein
MENVEKAVREVLLELRCPSGVKKTDIDWTSAVGPLIVDIRRPDENVCQGPTTDSCAAAKCAHFHCTHVSVGGAVHNIRNGHPAIHARQVFAGVASIIDTAEPVGITRCNMKPAALSKSCNSARVRSRACPNMAIICISTR